MYIWSENFQKKILIFLQSENFQEFFTKIYLTEQCLSFASKAANFFSLRCLAQDSSIPFSPFGHDLSISSRRAFFVWTKQRYITISIVGTIFQSKLAFHLNNPSWRLQLLRLNGNWQGKKHQQYPRYCI